MEEFVAMPKSLIEDILRYFADKPYKEVAMLIHRIHSESAVLKSKPEEEAQKSI